MLYSILISNAYGDLYVGNQKINAITGEVEILDKPILRVAGSAVAVNEEYVPYVAGGKNVILKVILPLMVVKETIVQIDSLI